MLDEKKNARSAVGATEQAAGANFVGQVPGKKYTTFADSTHSKIYNLLPHGAGHAVSKAILMEITGMGDRELRMQIQRARLAGSPILADCSSGGYYLPDNAEEVRDFVRSMRHRGTETLAVADTVEKSVLLEIERGEVRHGEETTGVNAIF